jgi:hypothetical protein
LARVRPIRSKCFLKIARSSDPSWAPENTKLASQPASGKE